ncbi:hypothetical protein Tco_0020414 [Tanacetum coccineum]
MIAFSKSRNSFKNIPRFSSNDMVYNHYLEEAKKKTQERDRNSKTSVTPSTRFQSSTEGHRFSPNKTSAVYEKTSPRSCLRWKSMGRILKTVGLRWIPRQKSFDSYTGKVDSEPPHGSNIDISILHECKQTLDLSAGTSINGQKKQSIDLSAGTSYNVSKENL